MFSKGLVMLLYGLSLPSHEYERWMFEVKHHMGIFWKHPCSRAERREAGAIALLPL